MRDCLKEKYAQQANPVWPMTRRRIGRIYATIGRAIRKPNKEQKEQVLNELLQLGAHFDTQLALWSQSPEAFDNWHKTALDKLQSVPFEWCDSTGATQSNLTLGAAQKFLNLMLKDWWACASSGSEGVVPFLHAPLDKQVYDITSRFFTALPSLVDRKGFYRSYVYYLSANDYDQYQKQVEGMKEGWQRLGCKALCRIESEQALWGWV